MFNYKKESVLMALVLVSTTGLAQTPQDSIDAVDRMFNLKEVVVKGGLPHTRLKGNAMVTRVDGTALASSGSLGELLVKVPGMTGTDEAPEVLVRMCRLAWGHNRSLIAALICAILLRETGTASWLYFIMSWVVPAREMICSTWSRLTIKARWQRTIIG